MSKLRYQFGLIASMLMFAGCSSDEATVNEGVAADGTTTAAGNELSAGLEGPATTTATPEASNTGDGLGGTTTDEQTAATGDAPAGDDAAKAEDKYKVVAHFLNVRKGPGNSFPVVRVLKKGDTVQAHDKSGIWLKISENEFVSSRFVSAP